MNHYSGMQTNNQQFDTQIANLCPPSINQGQPPQPSSLSFKILSSNELQKSDQISDRASNQNTNRFYTDQSAFDYQIYNQVSNYTKEIKLSIAKVSNDLEKMKANLDFIATQQQLTQQMAYDVLLQQQAINNAMLPLLRRFDEQESKKTQLQSKEGAKNEQAKPELSFNSSNNGNQTNKVQEPLINEEEKNQAPAKIDETYYQDSSDLRVKKQSGRRPVPIEEYIITRELKIRNLHMLSIDKHLTVDDRKKYRAQMFALKKRLEMKKKSHQRKMQQQKGFL